MCNSTIKPIWQTSSTIAEDRRFNEINAQIDRLRETMESVVMRISTAEPGKTQKSLSRSSKFTAEQWSNYRMQQRYGSTSSIASKDEARSVRSAKTVDESSDEGSVVREKSRRDRRPVERGTEDLYDPHPEREHYSSRRTLHIPSRSHTDVLGFTREPLRANPFGELRFLGDRQHPMRFFNDFLRIADYEQMEDRDRLYFFRMCLTDKARDWFDYQEFDEFEEATQVP